MATASKPRIRVPATATPGEVIEIKTLISHEMETGQRKDPSGNPIPRKIINKFIAKFNGKDVFSADWYPSLSANPYQSFFFKAQESGTFEFVWTDDDGSTYSATSELKVG
ncbi:MAG: thiosulfate oxidation carrier complex protein SoxZ [Rhodomicrobium sp.]|nr:thiosulfate oxidation carrier complex protein SoxZ [Rhodomicrobium sp.]